MNFSKFDLMIITIMAGAVVLMGFAFPALGMAGEEQTQSDVPQYNVTKDRFDLGAEYPPYPIQADEGTLNHSSDEFDEHRGTIQIELGASSAGNRTFLVANPEDTVYLTDVEASTIDDTHTFTNESETASLEAYGYEVDVKAIDLTTGTHDYIIQKRPGESSIPILGGVLDATDATAKVLWWILNLIGYGIRVLIEVPLNIGGIAFDTVVYIVSTIHWLLSTYFGIVDNAPNWTAVILTIPGIVLFLEFVKMSWIMLNMVNPR